MTVNPTDNVRNARISLDDVQAAKKTNVHSQEPPVSVQLTKIIQDTITEAQKQLSKASDILLDAVREFKVPVTIDDLKSIFKEYKDRLNRLNQVKDQSDVKEISNKFKNLISLPSALMVLVGPEFRQVMEEKYIPKITSILYTLDNLPDKINPVLRDALNEANDNILAARKEIIKNLGVDSPLEKTLTGMLGTIDDIRNENLFSKRFQEVIGNLKDKCKTLIVILNQRHLGSIIPILQNAKSALDDALFNTIPPLAKRGSRRNLKVIGW